MNEKNTPDPDPEDDQPSFMEPAENSDANSSSAHPNPDTFNRLHPEKILGAVEALGLKTTGRFFALNSMENRVYQVEVEHVPEDANGPHEIFLVAKFYRPGRWSEEQLLEEHQFLFDLANEEIPVVAPLVFGGKSLFLDSEIGIRYALFPRQGGRIPEEMDEEQLEVVGRLLARLHAVGRTRETKHRLELSPETYGLAGLEFLLKKGLLPSDLRGPYEKVVHEICALSAPLFKGVAKQRIHGDFHLGNLIWGPQGPVMLDFDDMVKGPCVQDIWPVVPDRDPQSVWRRNVLLSAYETMEHFDWTSLRLIEPLRALRMIHFSAWIGKRWDDESFRRIFYHYGTDAYWGEQLATLKEQLTLMPS